MINLRAITALVCLSLTGACQAEDQQSELRALILSKVPTEHALAASVRLMGCERNGDAAHCKVCQVTVHGDDPEYIAYATLFDHEIRMEGEEPKIAITSDLGSEKFTTAIMRKISPDGVFHLAENWCEQAAGPDAEYVSVKPLAK